MGLPQETAPRCRGRLIRECGDIVVGVDALVQAVVSLMEAEKETPL